MKWLKGFQLFKEAKTNFQVQAQNDLEKITKMTYAMVTIYGMSEKVGNISYYDPNNEYGFTKPYSEETAKIIDQEVRKLIDEMFVRTKNLLTEKREQLEILAQELLKKEVLFQADLERLIGRRQWEIKNVPHVIEIPAEEKAEETKTETQPETHREPGIDWKPNLNPPLA